MNDQDVKLTLQEAEQLCRLYINCKLTVLEETELQYVLGKLPYSSPCIDETRMLMGVSIPVGTIKSSSKRHGWFNRKFAIGIAASVAILFTVGIALFNSQTAKEQDSSELYIAYANGEEVDQEQAVRLVKSDMKRADEFLNHMAELEAQEREKVELFTNQISHEE